MNVGQTMKLTSKFSELGIPYEVDDNHFQYPIHTKADDKSLGVIVESKDDNKASVKIFDEKADEQKCAYTLELDGVEKVELFGTTYKDEKCVWGKVIFR